MGKASKKKGDERDEEREKYDEIENETEDGK
jgi:hypothetical protein